MEGSGKNLVFGQFVGTDRQTVVLLEFCPNPSWVEMLWVRETGKTKTIVGRVLLGSSSKSCGWKSGDMGSSSRAAYLMQSFIQEAPEGTDLVVATKCDSSFGHRYSSETLHVDYYGPIATLNGEQVPDGGREKTWADDFRDRLGCRFG